MTDIPLDVFTDRAKFSKSYSYSLRGPGAADNRQVSEGEGLNSR